MSANAIANAEINPLGLAQSKESELLAKASAVSKTLKSGAVALRAMSRKEFKEAFGLSNKDAKRLHAAHCARWQSEQQIHVNTAFEAGFKVAKTTSKSGKHADRLTVVMVKPKGDKSETKNETIARLQAELEVLKAAAKKA